ncbi:MAG TPA: efflux RND transporter periplasmic adaptor subunit [Vicinamibacterales bacterium]|nr:efflux RND transporter periplasmic adaptor subunit [Vicinamibacterales bacterium]
MKISRKKVFIGVGVVVVLAAIAIANLKFRRTNAASVEVETIKTHDLEAIVSASGKIQPKRSVNISADTMGRVVDLAVEEGQTVRKGQFLLQIDPRNLQTRVESGEAGFRAAQAQLVQMEVALEASRTALKLAQDTLNRQRELWRQGLTTKENLDRAETEARQREIEVQNQQKQIDTARIRAGQERANLANARYDLSKVRIESPIDGIVTRRNIEEGETVVIGTMNNPGTQLLTIADMSIIEAEVEVDETDIPSVQMGQRAKVTIDAMPDKTFYGKVTEIGNSPIQAAQAGGQRQATNFKVVVTLEQQIADVRPGFTCTAEITTATRKNVVGVPIQATTVREMTVDEKGAIVRAPAESGRRRPSSGGVQAAELKPGQTRKEIEGVFVVRDGKAVFIPVTTGIAGEKYFEVLSGLKSGDRVVIGPFSSVRTLADGDAVKIEEPRRRT